MTTIPAFVLIHRVQVEPYLGVGPSGPVYGPAVEVRCLKEDKVRLVRSPEGDEVISSATFYAMPGTVAPAKSRVTLPGGRKTTVITFVDADGGNLGTPNHVEVQLV
ncbi:hypothetical protein L1085_016365 [Streptomyces sp. MSC1_001]|jgi:hypothetical protein|uniref:hypothetical protein n=1 Tax=Streptomyces sp. MSC1_001 TaxID=2909263 RepID=UPI002030CBD4|nr:hypothetical protein [Streptomyces sp. MSC1_001]